MVGLRNCPLHCHEALKPALYPFRLMAARIASLTGQTASWRTRSALERPTRAHVGWLHVPRCGDKLWCYQFCMKIIYKLASLSALLLFSVSGSARAQHMNLVDTPCRDNAATVDAVKCLDLAAKQADANLNKTYRTILKFLPPDVKLSVVNAQRLWGRYREASCSAERSLYGNGTAAEPAYLACLEATTRQQTTALRNAYWWRVEKFSD